MLDLLLFMLLPIFTLLTTNKSSHTSVHSFYCVSWVLVVSTKGMRLRSFAVNEKLKIVKEAEETSNCFTARLVWYFLFIYLLCWFWRCTAYSNHALCAYEFRNPYFYVFLFVYHILSHSLFRTPMKLIVHALQVVFVFQILRQVYVPWLWPLWFSIYLSEIPNVIFHNVLDLSFMLDLFLFTPL